jgi:hypothetical protein
MSLGGVGRQGLPRTTAECWTRDLQDICFEVGLLQRFLAVSLAARKFFCCPSQNLAKRAIAGESAAYWIGKCHWAVSIVVV